MKTVLKISVAALSMLLLVCMFMLTSCGDNNSAITPPAPEYKVYSVTLKYNNVNVDGIINVDLSMKEIQLTATVRKDSKADGTVHYSSLNNSVATVDQNGKVTLHAKGEAVISARAGDKMHSIIVNVGNDYSENNTYTITVIGGTASVTAAAPGEYVTITPVIPDHKEFSRWNYSVRGVLTNGNSFRMPEEDLVITAEYVDKLYTLNVVGASTIITSEGEELVGEVIDNLKKGNRAEYNVVSYSVKYGTELKVKALPDPNGMVFVGWDAGVVNNRVGEMGVKEYSFTMPGETYTIWANYSTLNTQVLTKNPSNYWNAGQGSKAITNGTPSGEENDPDLEGLSGYRLTFTAGERGITDFPENIASSCNIDTVAEGSNALKVILKNHGDFDVTLEIYATYNGNIATSGHITVPAHSTVTKFFKAGLGINLPWMGIALRETIGGTSADGTFNVDVVLGAAPMYPEGDPLIKPSGKAELVKIDTSTNKTYVTDVKFKYNEQYGYLTFATYGALLNKGGLSETNPAASVVKITNMPEYDPENPYTTVYVRVINNATSGDFLSIFDVCVGTDADPRFGKNTYCKTVVHEKIGDVVVVAITVPRTANDGPFYFSIVKRTLEGTDTYYPHNFSLVLAYNNVFGYEEEASK